MTDNIVDISPQRRVWVCNCGCSSFRLFSDGVAECCHCCSPVSGATDGWQSETKDAGVRGNASPEKTSIEFNSNADFALYHIRKRVSADDVALIIVAAEDSRTSIWAQAQNMAQKKWTEDRIADAVGLLNDWQFEASDIEGE
ncbi:hypothetical protein ACRARG_04610 [Pseudooceanicola sp. C21-150M6]|uniref:hypothetical protein n=1 Tax=Pseudooceanicola sp. C21-150M6 TaxID=3434355 RepID=UPI003D7F6B32